MSDLSGQQIVFVPSLGDPADPGQRQVTRQNFTATNFTDGGGFSEPVYSGGGFSSASDPVVTEDVTSGPGSFTLTGNSSSPGTAAYEARSNFYVFQLPASTNFVFTSANLTFSSNYYEEADPTSHFSFDGDHIYVYIGGKELARSSYVIHFTVQPLSIASTTTGMSDISRAGAAAVIVDGGVTVAYNGGDLTNATVQIGAGFTSGDRLNFTDQNGITGSYDAGGGVLTLTGAATAGDYQTALQSVTFSTGASTFGGARTVGFSVSDGGGTSSATSGHVSTITSDTVQVIGLPTATGTGGPSGTGALHGASAPGGGTLSITSVTGVGAAQPVAAGSTSTNNPTTVTGSYGELTIGADGSYSYSADNGLAIVSHPDGSPIVDTFADVVTSSGGGTSNGSVPVTVSLAAGGVERVINPAGAATYTIGATTLILDERAAGTFGGVIQDGTNGNHGGAVVVTGNSPLTLSGASTYTGGTTLSAGAGQVTAANTSALGAGAVTDNAALAYAGATGTVVNAVSGTGALSVSGVSAGGTLAFSGALTQGGGFTVTDASGVTLAATGSYAGGSAIRTNGGAFTILGAAGTAAGSDGLVAQNGGVITVGTAGGASASLDGGDSGVNESGAAADLTVNNFGLIQGRNYEGVTYRAVGTLTLTNAGGGVIYGQGNSETTAWGVGDGGGLSDYVLNVTNQSGGSIIGRGFGVYGVNAADVISNSGLIGVGSYSAGAYARGSAAAAAGTTSGAAVYLEKGGAVTNAATGVISGSGSTAYQSGNLAAGVVAYGGVLTVDNGGAISGGVYGVAQAYGTVNVVNRAGATITGATSDAIYVYVFPGSSITNAGVLTGGNAGVYVDGADLTLVNTGTITQVGGAANTVTSGVYDSAGGATITNSGVIQSTVSGGSGIFLEGADETVVNQVGGTISGGSGGGLGLKLTGAGNAVTLNAGSTVNGGVSATATTGADVLTVYNGQGSVNGGTQAAASFGAVSLAGATNTINLRGAGDGTTAQGVAGSLNLANVTAANGFALNKLDAGVWTLMGASTNTGPTTVAAGVLAVDATAYASAITVTGGVLRGTATSSAGVTVGSGATFAPGEGGAGAFRTSSALALNTGAVLAVAAASAGAYTNVEAASATLGGALNFTYTAGAEAFGTTYDIVHVTGAAAVSGTFSNYAPGTTLVSGGRTFQVSYTGGPSGHDVVLTDVAAGPLTVTNSSAGQAIDDQHAAAPFAAVAVSNPDGGRAETATITYAAANGTLSGAGLAGSAGSYTLSAASAAALQGALQAVVFTPTANQVAPGLTVVTTFGIAVSDGVSSVTTSDTVTTTSVNDAPTVAGTHASTVDDHATVSPFSGVTVGDPDPPQTETATITYAAAAGALSYGGGAAGVSFSGSPGSYTLSAGSAADLTTALRAVGFAPIAMGPGPSTDAAFTLSVSDGGASSGADTGTVVTVTHTQPTGDELIVAAGTTTTVSTVQTYTGKTRVFGELDLAAGGSIASSQQLALKASGAVFDVSGAGAGGATVTIKEFSGVAGSTLKLGSGVLSLTESVTASFSGAITDGGVSGGAGGSLVVNGTVPLTLSGADTYTGKTQIYGQLDLAGAAVLNQSKAVTLKSASAVFDISQATGKEAILNLAGVAGSHIYLGANTLKINDSTAAIFSGVIADGGAAGGVGGALIVKGTVPLVLAGANTFTGGVTLQTGTLELTTPTSAGAGGHSLTFAGAATLQLDAGAVTGSGASHSYGTIIAGFATSDYIDLASLTYALGATATHSSGALTVTSGGSSVVLTLTGIAAGASFTTADDGHGHVLVGLVGTS